MQSEPWAPVTFNEPGTRAEVASFDGRVTVTVEREGQQVHITRNVVGQVQQHKYRRAWESGSNELAIAANAELNWLTRRMYGSLCREEALWIVEPAHSRERKSSTHAIGVSSNSTGAQSK